MSLSASTSGPLAAVNMKFTCMQSHYVHTIHVVYVLLLLFCCSAVLLLYYCWFSETAMRGTVPQSSASDGRVCFLCVRCIEHGDAFHEGIQWYSKTEFGREKKWDWRIGHSSILIGHQGRPVRSMLRFAKRLHYFQVNSIPISITGQITSAHYLNRKTPQRRTPSIGPLAKRSRPRAIDVVFDILSSATMPTPRISAGASI